MSKGTPLSSPALEMDHSPALELTAGEPAPPHASVEVIQTSDPWIGYTSAPWRLHQDFYFSGSHTLDAEWTGQHWTAAPTLAARTAFRKRYAKADISINYTPPSSGTLNYACTFYLDPNNVPLLDPVYGIQGNGWNISRPHGTVNQPYATGYLSVPASVAYSGGVTTELIPEIQNFLANTGNITSNSNETQFVYHNDLGPGTASMDTTITLSSEIKPPIDIIVGRASSASWPTWNDGGEADANLGPYDYNNNKTGSFANDTATPNSAFQDTDISAIVESNYDGSDDNTGTSGFNAFASDFPSASGIPLNAMGFALWGGWYYHSAEDGPIGTNNPWDNGVKLYARRTRMVSAVDFNYFIAKATLAIDGGGNTCLNTFSTAGAQLLSQGTKKKYSILEIPMPSGADLNFNGCTTHAALNTLAFGVVIFCVINETPAAWSARTGVAIS